MRIPAWAPVLTDDRGGGGGDGGRGDGGDGSLRLRGHRPEDLDGVLEQCRDVQTQRWTGVPVPYLRQHGEDYLATREREWTAGRRPTFAVESGGRFAGSIGLNCARDATAWLSYGLAPWARGRGLTERAVRLLLPWAWQALDLSVVLCRARVGNWAGRRVAWACGFRIDGPVAGLCGQNEVAHDGWIGTLRRDEEMSPRHPWYDVPTLRAHGVTLRPHRDQDAERIAQACADPLSQQWLPALPSPYGVQQAHGHLARMVEIHASGGGLHWAVTAAGDEGLLGEVGLFVDDERRGGEVGYWAHPRARGRRLTTAAVRLVARHGLLPADDGGLGLDRILIRAAAGNLASQRVAAAAGFRRSGLDRDGERLRDGSLMDLVRYDLLAGECP